MMIETLVLNTLKEWFLKYREECNKELKVITPTFIEKNIDNKTMLKISSSSNIVITPDDRNVPGEHIIEYYGYAKFGKLKYAISNKYTKIRKVSIMYANDDFINKPTDLNDLKKELMFEKLHKKTKRKEPVFETNCELYYISKNKYCIKNFLVLVDGGKNGYDLFVLQTFQDALFNWKTKYIIDDDKNITDFSILFTPEKIKNRKGLETRTVTLDNLNEMNRPFIIDGKEFQTGRGTQLFYDFVNDFNNKYNLNLV